MIVSTQVNLDKHEKDPKGYRVHLYFFLQKISIDFYPLVRSLHDLTNFC